MNKIVYREIQFSSVAQSCLTLCNTLDRQGYIQRVVKILTQCSLKQFETSCDDTDRLFSRKINRKRQNLSLFTGELREKPAAQPVILEAGLSLSLIHWHRVKFSRSVVSDSLRPHGLQHQASLSFTNSQSMLKLMCIESVVSSNHLILCCSLLHLPSVFPSIKVFPKKSVCRIRWPKYLSLYFSNQSFQ